VEEALLSREEGMKVRGNALLLQEEASGYRLWWVGVVATLIMTLLLLMVVYVRPALADTFTVTNLNNTGPGSLREAINAAEANAGAEEIMFADGVSGTITLASTLPTVTDSEGLTIDGGGDVAVSGDDAVQVFVMSPEAKLSLRNLTVSDGLAFARGGGVFNGGGTLTVDGSTFSGNNSDLYGGGIFNDDGGMLRVNGSTFSDNWASDYGGGIFNDQGADFTLSDSTFSGNSTADVGAGIANLGGAVGITGSTFSGNVSDVTGGGITNEAGTLEVSNSTFSGNAATEKGGGIDSVGGSVEVFNSTFSGNGAFDGGGIAASPFSGGTVTLRGTIVVNNPIGDNCSGPIADGAYNIDDDGTCGFDPATGSLPNTNPLLDPAGLADNGGPTQTIALLPESPAVDLVGQEACPPPETDQRGVERPQGEACDSGAFELVQGPQTKTDCNNGGWEEFGFKNQGQCIASLRKEQVQTSQ
jgi:hypothetical protein